KPFTKFHPPRGFENHLSILFHAFLPVFSALFTPTCFAFAAAFTPSCFFPQLISPVFYPLLIKKHPVLLDLHNNPISRKPCTRSWLPAMPDSVPPAPADPVSSWPPNFLHPCPYIMASSSRKIVTFKIICYITGHLHKQLHYQRNHWQPIGISSTN